MIVEIFDTYSWSRYEQPLYLYLLITQYSYLENVFYI